MYKQIVVGTDGSPGADMAVDTAIELARLTGARLHVVHAQKLAGAPQISAAVGAGVMPNVVEVNEEVRAASQRLCDQVVAKAGHAGVQAEAHCVSGDAADALVRVASDADADVIVVGNRGMAGARRVLGSVPNKVSHHCPSSLLIVDTSGATR